MRFVNIHRFDFTCHFPNVGDIASSPLNYYFHGARARKIDIFNSRALVVAPDENVVFGGGGLFYPDFRLKIRSFLQSGHPLPVIGWGIGHNTHHVRAVDYSEIPSEGFTLLGVRDWVDNHRWVPCASCKHPIFDACPAPEYPVVVYNHRDFLTGVDPGFAPTLDNGGRDMEAVVRFLAKGETVITSSYHGAYWATLLRRKVVVLHAFSSKFYKMRHPPQICETIDRLNVSLAQARSFPTALDECRKANDDFNNDVCAVLHLET